MSDHDEVERLSRRTLLKLGLLTAGAAAHGPLIFPPDAGAQTTKPGVNLIGKLEGAEVIRIRPSSQELHGGPSP